MVIKMILLSVILVFLYIFWSFLMVNDHFGSFDAKIYKAMKFNEGKIKFFRLFTNLGSVKFYLPVCILWVLISKDKQMAWFISGVMLLSSVVIWLFKHIFKRERPNIRRLVHEKGFSYPSGHMMSSTVFYGFIIFLLILSDLLFPLKVLFASILVVLVLSIGYSRIFLGVHYFSDIIGALLLGLSYLLIFINFI